MRQNGAVWFAILMIAGATVCEGQSAHYRRQKTVVLNDLQVTAGATRTVSAAEVCSAAMGTVRHVTPKMKSRSVRSTLCRPHGATAGISRSTI